MEQRRTISQYVLLEWNESDFYYQIILDKLKKT